MPPTADVAVFRAFRDPVLAVWPYWSRPELLERWLGSVDLELEVGGELQAKLWNGDSIQGRVLAVAPPNRLDLAWKGNGPDGESEVRIRLDHQGPGCRVRVENGIPGGDLEHGQAGTWWNAALEALHAAVGGSMEAHRWGDGLPIVLRVPLAREAADVWPLLSTAAGLEKWLAGAERFDPEPGGAFRFLSRFKGLEVVEEGTVLEIETNRFVALSWTWVGQGWQAPTRVELRLDPDPAGAALVIAHSGFESLAPDERLAARVNYAAAWRDVMDDVKRLVAPGPT